MLLVTITFIILSFRLFNKKNKYFSTENRNRKSGNRIYYFKRICNQWHKNLTLE